MTSKPELERLGGTVSRSLVRDRTASEHVAVILETRTGDRLILQRIGGNPFDDEVTRGLAGHEVLVEGYRLGDIFRFVKARLTDA